MSSPEITDCGIIIINNQKIIVDINEQVRVSVIRTLTKMKFHFIFTTDMLAPITVVFL